MKISYIISYRGSDFRERNLSFILDWLRSVNHIDEIIVVEQDLSQTLDENKLSKKEKIINDVYHQVGLSKTQFTNQEMNI